MKTFIHISDLHIAAMNKPGIKGKNERTEKTWLNAREDKDNDNYIEEFCDSVKSQFKGKEREYYLLISGDIADSSSEIEYKFAKQFLEQIQNELKIEKNKILLVPGNHDVYRPKCRSAADEYPEKRAYEHLEAKYENFKCFYDSFYKEIDKQFGVDKQIVDYLALKSEKLLFVGINTNYKIDYQGGSGAVDKNKLKEELNILCENYKNYIKIAVFHHNILSDSEEDNSYYGSWDKTDWIDFKKCLEEKEFNMVMFGNEHTRASSRKFNTSQEDSLMYFSDSGSFALHDNTCVPSYKVYELNHDQNRTSLRQYLFQLDDKGHVGVRSYGRWCKQVNKDHGELEEFVLRLKKNNQLKEEDPNLSNIEVSSTSAKRGKTDSARGKEKRRNLAQKKYGDLESLNDMDFQKEMMSIIRSEHLYHPGHFHWGKSSRSHNWIDTISLLNDRKYIIKIQSKIRSLIKEIREKRNFKYDIIIGIGMEGNIMSTQLLLEDIPYAYLPYTYRYDEFNDFEKSVCLSNSDDKYKNVLIITDVVNKGRMLRNLITEKEEDFFADVEHIHVVSLFYTGQIENNRKQKNTKIIMPDGLKDITKKIEFYPLLQLEVGKCPYGDEEFEEQCTIYKNHLCEVYKFYNE